MELNPKQKEEIDESIQELRNIPNITGVYIADINGRLISWNARNSLSEKKDIGAAIALLSSMLKIAKDVEQILNPNNENTEFSRVVVSLWGEQTMVMQAGQEAILIIQFGRSGAAHLDIINTAAEKISKSISRTFLSRIKVKQVTTA